MASASDDPQTKKGLAGTLTERTAQIDVLGPTGFSTRGRILERSHVLRLLLFQELARGTLVQIRTPDEILLGEVRHCRHTSRGHTSRRSFDVALRVQTITKLLPGLE